MLFLLAVVLLLAVAGLAWVKSDEALAHGDVLAAGGYWALYGALAVATLLGVH